MKVSRYRTPATSAVLRIELIEGRFVVGGSGGGHVSLLVVAGALSRVGVVVGLVGVDCA